MTEPEYDPDTNELHDAGPAFAEAPPVDPAPEYLLVCIGANVGHRYPLGDEPVLMGSASTCDIVVTDDRVSERHAVIVPGHPGPRLVDLGSWAGTLVNAQPVDDVQLCGGDLIQVGMTVLRYMEEATTAPGTSDEKMPSNREPGALRLSARTVHGPSALQVRTSAARAMVRSRAPHAWVNARRMRDASWDGEVAGQRGHILVQHDEDEPVSLAELILQVRRAVGFFWPYRTLIAGCASAGLVLGASSLVLFPPRATASFDVRLHSKASANPLERFEGGHVEFFRSAPTTFRSTALIARTLAALGEHAASAERLDDVQHALAFDNTSMDESTQTWTGRFQGETGAHGLAFLTKHVEVYLGAEIEKTLKIIKAQVEFLQLQLEETEKQLRATEARLLTFKRENIDGLPEQARQYYDYLFELQRKESDLASTVNRLEAEVAVDARRLETESPLVESRVLATRPYQQAIVDVNRQRAEARARGLGDGHPDMQQLELRLTELKRLASEAEHSTDETEVERSRNPIYESTAERLNRLRVAAAATREERVRLRQDQQRVKAIVDKLPKLEAEYAELTRSYDATKQLHTRIFDELKSAQLQYELERASASARYEIITAPRLEHVSHVRTGVKRGLLVALLGMSAGVAAATWLQVRRRMAALVP